MFVTADSEPFARRPQNSGSEPCRASNQWSGSNRIWPSKHCAPIAGQRVQLAAFSKLTKPAEIVVGSSKPPSSTVAKSL